MSSAFSTNDADNLNRQTEHVNRVENLNEIWNKQRLDECIKWIDSHQYENVSIKKNNSHTHIHILKIVLSYVLILLINQIEQVCLQFSDDLIPFSTEIINELKNHTSAELCILGDTSYGSCCVDEVSMQQSVANKQILKKILQIFIDGFGLFFVNINFNFNSFDKFSR